MDNVIEILRRNAFTAKKKYGQNFIVDPKLLSAIVSDAEINEDDVVVEIGAGAGTLTRALGERAKQVYAFEIDESLKDILDITLSGLNNIQIIYKDILKTDREELRALAGGGRFKVVANLPYYITTPVLFYFLDSDLPIDSITVMVQREVALRMVAKSSTSDYGVLTLSIQSRGTARMTRFVGKEMFHPRPVVDSSVVRIDLNGDKMDERLFKLIRCAFSMRRKTLANNLIASYGLNRHEAEQILSDAGINIKARGEALDLKDFIRLSAILNQ